MHVACTSDAQLQAILICNLLQSNSKMNCSLYYQFQAFKIIKVTGGRLRDRSLCPDVYH